MKNHKILEYIHNPETDKYEAYTSFHEKRVIGVTMAPDGTTYANLSGFRQARIRYDDYMKLKERKFPWTLAPNPK